MFSKNSQSAHEFLLESLATGDSSGAIERQEKRGQTQFVASQTLPIKMNCTRAQLEAGGFVFGKDLDDLFVECQFPPGWSKQATDHSMWSNLMDDKGRVRGSIFFKAAFYDRDAFLTLKSRFQVTIQTKHEGQRGGVGEIISFVVSDSGQVAYESETTLPQPDFQDREKFWEWDSKKETLRQQCREWLSAHYPDWENPLAYWD